MSEPIAPQWSRSGSRDGPEKNFVGGRKVIKHVTGQ